MVIEELNVHNISIKDSFYITDMEDFPPEANPFNHDIARMGTPIGTDWMIMYDKHQVNPYLVIVHIPTGKRVLIGAPGQVANIS
jgi:hypothetical protein